MRKIAEIQKDLSVASKALETVDLKDQAAVDAASANVDALMKELDIAKKAEMAARAAAEEQFKSMEKKEGRKFSFVKFIREAAEGKLTGLEAEVADLGAAEYERLGIRREGFVIPSAALRASTGQNAGTNADGGYLKEAMPIRYIDALKERLVVAQLGATLLGDLVGELPVVTGGNISAGWGAEGDEASVTKIAFSKASLTPHRNFIDCAFSKDLLRQTSVDVEAIVMSKILDAHARLVEAAAINGSGSNDQPTGILNTANIGSVVMGTNGGAISWAKVVELETKINQENANRGKVAYLTNAKVVGAMKTTEKASNTARFILDVDGKVNGYNYEQTALVPSNLTKGSSSGVCSALIFGNFEDLWIGQWGGLDIVVDPFALKKKAEVEICLNAWNDCKVVEPKSFAAIKDITTA